MSLTRSKIEIEWQFDIEKLNILILGSSLFKIIQSSAVIFMQLHVLKITILLFLE